MPTLLEQVADQDNLRKAFLRSKRSIGSKSRRAIEDHKSLWRTWAAESESLSLQLKAKTYKTEGYTAAVIRQEGKKDRPILISTAKDSVVQNAVLRIIRPLLAGEEAQAISESRSSIRGLVLSIWAHLHEREVYVFETDIVRFFDRIDRTLLLAALDKLLPDNSLTWLLEQYIDTLPSQYSYSAKGYEDLWEPDLGIPQGSVLSPLLADTYLYSFDHIVKKSFPHYYRYVDDLLILCDDAEEARDAATLVTKAAGEHRIEVHPVGSPKGNILEPRTTFSFLGIRFGRTLKPAGSYKTKLRDKVCTVLDADGLTLMDAILRINRLLTGWYQAYEFCNLSIAELRDLDKMTASLLDKWSNTRNLGLRYNFHDIEFARSMGLICLADKRIPRTKVIDPDSEVVSSDDPIFAMLDEDDVYTSSGGSGDK